MSDGAAAATPQKVQLPIARVIEDVDADLAGVNIWLMYPAASRDVVCCCFRVDAVSLSVKQLLQGGQQTNGYRSSMNITKRMAWWSSN
jgi:hypothetical protein